MKVFQAVLTASLVMAPVAANAKDWDFGVRESRSETVTSKTTTRQKEISNNSGVYGEHTTRQTDSSGGNTNPHNTDEDRYIGGFYHRF